MHYIYAEANINNAYNTYITHSILFNMCSKIFFFFPHTGCSALPALVHVYTSCPKRYKHVQSALSKQKCLSGSIRSSVWLSMFPSFEVRIGWVVTLSTVTIHRQSKDNASARFKHALLLANLKCALRVHLTNYSIPER